MRLLFAFDHRFHRSPSGQVHTSGAFPAWVWERYLDHFDEVRVIARDGGPIPDGLNLGRSDRERVTFEFLPNLSTFRQLVAPSAKAVERMRSAVREADAVVARLPSEIGLMAAREAKRQDKPLAIELVGCAWDGLMHYGAASAQIYAPLQLHRVRAAVRNAPLVLYVTSSWLQRRYPTRGHSAFASNVDIVPLSEEARARRERRLAEIAQGRPPVLGTIASLSMKTKGVQTAIEALARLRSQGLDLNYRVLGPGPTEPWVRLAERWEVADLVDFDGTRSAGDGVRSWLDDIDIYLQPSFQEGLPRATIEAMSRGCACIGSTCGGIPELLPPERLHKPGDVAGLVKAIQALAGDPAAVASASSDGIERSRAYVPEELGARRHDFFARLRKAAEATSKAA